MKKCLCVVVLCAAALAAPFEATARSSGEQIFNDLLNMAIREAKKSQSNTLSSTQKPARTSSKKKTTAKKTSTNNASKLNEGPFDAKKEREFITIFQSGSVQKLRAKLEKENISSNARFAYDNEMGGIDTSLLHIAASYSPNAELVKFLLDKGANVNKTDQIEGTPLLNAAFTNPQTAIIRALIDAGASVNAKTFENQSVLMAAAANSYNPNPDVIVILLNAGANAKLKNNSGMRAIDYARENPKLKGTQALKMLEAASR